LVDFLYCGLDSIDSKISVLRMIETVKTNSKVAKVWIKLDKDIG